MGIFVVKRSEDENGKPVQGVDIGVQTVNGTEVLWIFTNVASQGEFEHIVATLKKDLDYAVREVTRILGEIKAEEEGDKVLKPGMDPEDAWQIMENAEEDEIFGMFNNLPDKDRKALANFVFTKLNVFKGRAMYFSQHYDYGSNLLLQDKDISSQA